MVLPYMINTILNYFICISNNPLNFFAIELCNKNAWINDCSQLLKCYDISQHLIYHFEWYDQ